MYVRRLTFNKYITLLSNSHPAQGSTSVTVSPCQQPSHSCPQRPTTAKSLRFSYSSTSSWTLVESAERWSVVQASTWHRPSVPRAPTTGLRVPLVSKPTYPGHCRSPRMHHPLRPARTSVRAKHEHGMSPTPQEQALNKMPVHAVLSERNVA